MTPEQVENLSADLRGAYARLRRLTNPNFQHRSKHERMWNNLARILAESGISGKPYVKWAYEFYQRRQPTVWPEQITSPKTVKIYREREPDHRNTLKLLCELQMDTIRVLLDRGKTPREVVEDLSLDLGVVVRYALARQAGLEDLVQQLRVDAEDELFFEPLCREWLGQFLPVVNGEGS
jgi:hypothetical protein